ncbi:hypothetical protein [Lactobacillus equicursoris]|uniref:hypothetical protein n=1 Tax=Lactobacillus equicursoris TaxID=420645 RepID=UPI000587C9D1|nr:hypothetical protein [Lactobacillus equicursoris]
MTYYTSGEFAKKAHMHPGGAKRGVADAGVLLQGSRRWLPHYQGRWLIYLPQINKTAILLIIAVILCRINMQNREFDDIIS